MGPLNNFAKRKKISDMHEAEVESPGGSFFPLVVESFRLWTKDSLKTMNPKQQHKLRLN